MNKKQEERYTIHYSIASRTAPKVMLGYVMHGVDAEYLGNMVKEKASLMADGSWRLDGVTIDNEWQARESAMAGYVAQFGTASE